MSRQQSQRLQASAHAPGSSATDKLQDLPAPVSHDAQDSQVACPLGLVCWGHHRQLREGPCAYLLGYPFLNTQVEDTCCLHRTGELSEGWSAPNTVVQPSPAFPAACVSSTCLMQAMAAACTAACCCKPQHQPSRPASFVALHACCRLPSVPWPGGGCAPSCCPYPSRFEKLILACWPTHPLYAVSFGSACQLQLREWGCAAS